MSSLPNNPRLIASLKKTFADLATPLDMSIRNVWRGADRPPDGKVVLANQLLSVAKLFVDVRNCSIEEKQNYFEKVCRWFDLEAEKNAFPLPKPQSFSPNISQRFDRTPVAISYLEEYDRRHGFNYADRTRHALFEFANLVIKSDGTVTSAEAAALLQFKTTLYPNGGDPSSVEDNPSNTDESSTETVEDDPPRQLEDLLKELDGLVGLDRVKTDVRQLINFLKVQKMREDKGMVAPPMSRHLVFYGNPGTGKTTIARLLAQVYRSLQILSRGHLIESDRGDLVAGYVGQTALKVKQVVSKALGGVLFIDEAYALNAEGRGNDFGQEAVETLLKLMEDHRQDFVVIVAGYTEKMEEFVSSNPGLRSRFTKFLHFEDYTPEQLLEIFKGFCAKAAFKMTPAAERTLLELFKVLSLARDESFGNARTARNLFELTISKQANRIVTLANINEEVLSAIEESDIPTEEELGQSGVRLPPDGPAAHFVK